MAKQVMESPEDLQDLALWAHVPPCAHSHPCPHPAGLLVGAVSLGSSSSCLSLLWEPPAALVCGAERGGGVPRSPIPGCVPRHAAAVAGHCWAAPHLQGVVSPWEAGGKHPRPPCLLPDASTVSFPLAGLFSTQPFPAGSAHAVPVLKLSHTEEEEGECRPCAFSPHPPFPLLRVCGRSRPCPLLTGTEG